jgi:hypothetical protein
MAALGLASLPVMQQQYHPQQQQQQQMQSMQQMGMQQQQQQQQMILQPIAQAVPTPLDATAITIKLATLAGERFKVSRTSAADNSNRTCGSSTLHDVPMLISSVLVAFVSRVLRMSFTPSSMPTALSVAATRSITNRQRHVDRLDHRDYRT